MAQKNDEIAKLVTNQNDEIKKILFKSSNVEGYGYDGMRLPISRRVSFKPMNLND